ncbi:MAG: UDP-2,3-diacylglucosamine diphosphatase [Bacteroidales bacterium]|nr:UDP-2,3-diacylglucosamine diphosphatase [Bacteroidales bacterium]
MAALFQHPITINGTIYFASDFHFGAPNKAESAVREEAVVRWLDTIKEDANYLFLLGDIFDFWFEYKDVVPRGNFIFLAKLAELRKKGIVIYYFTGNHDMWVHNYFKEEIGMEVFHEQQAFLINGKKCIIGHGDGLDPKDKGYRLIKGIFAFRPNQIIYGALPPRWAFSLARFFSRNSRAMNHKKKGEKYVDGDCMLPYIKGVLQTEKIDLFVYGHRHVPIEQKLEDGAMYYNTGDWLDYDTYLYWKEPHTIQLLHFER